DSSHAEILRSTLDQVRKEGCGVSMAPTARRRTALVTGASSGIGEAFDDVFASAGFDLVLVARREERLRAVASRLEQQHAVRAHTIVCDLSQRGAIPDLVADLSTRGLS